MNIVKAGLATLRLAKKAAPVLISAAAGIGAVLTYILTIKETEQAQEVLQEADEEELHSVKMVKKIVKIYAPSFILLVVTLLCIVQSTIISQHRIRDLTASYAALATFTNNYRQKQIDIFGKETDDRIIQAIAEEKIQDDPPFDPDGILCFMPTYPHWFEVPSKECIFQAFLTANEYMDMNGHVMLNQLMEWMHTKEYDETGKEVGMDQRYIGFGWENFDLFTEESATGLYPRLSEFSEDSGLEGYIIDIPVPKPLELIL